MQNLEATEGPIGRSLAAEAVGREGLGTSDEMVVTLLPQGGQQKSTWSQMFAGFHHSHFKLLTPFKPQGSWRQWCALEADHHETVTMSALCRRYYCRSYKEGVRSMKWFALGTVVAEAGEEMEADPKPKFQANLVCGSLVDARTRVSPCQIWGLKYIVELVYGELMSKYTYCKMFANCSVVSCALSLLLFQVCSLLQLEAAQICEN